MIIFILKYKACKAPGKALGKKCVISADILPETYFKYICLLVLYQYKATGLCVKFYSNQYCRIAASAGVSKSRLFDTIQKFATNNITA